jgi:predicted RNA binding protein YcfA (HicA-like mRNA interferase family)/predicted RNase H-like HicB family nuclease
LNEAARADSEGYYVASVPQIPACHTQARSLDEVTERIREAIELCLEVEGTPEQDLEFVGIQRVTIAACRTPRITGSDLIAALARAGFRVLRVKGSHHFLRHEDGRSTVVPAHAGETLGPGLLHKILRDCQLTAEQLAELL